jgi:hypothetical protein
MVVVVIPLPHILNNNNQNLILLVFLCLSQNLKQTSPSVILFPDAKNSCMKKTTINQKAKNAQTSNSRPFAIQRGVKVKAKGQDSKKFPS